MSTSKLGRRRGTKAPSSSTGTNFVCPTGDAPDTIISGGYTKTSKPNRSRLGKMQRAIIGLIFIFLITTLILVFLLPESDSSSAAGIATTRRQKFLNAVRQKAEKIGPLLRRRGGIGGDNVGKPFNGNEQEESIDIPREKLKDLVRYVDVLRGTDNHGANSVSRGNILAIASRVLGMNHWAVVNTDSTRWPSLSWPFNPSNDLFKGIRCTHQPSPWIGDYAFFNFLPILEADSALGSRNEKYNNNDWIREPSYNKLSITSQCLTDDNEDISCTELELAASAHGGMYRITYPKASKLVGLSFQHMNSLSGDVWDNVITIKGVANKSYVMDRSRPKHMKLFVEFRVESITTNVDDENGESQISSDPISSIKQDTNRDERIVAWTHDAIESSSSATRTVLVRVGTSFISPEQASLNLESETGDKDFDELVEEGRYEWNQALNRVTVETDDNNGDENEDVKELKTQLYTCLYRGLLYPRQLGETNENGDTVHWSPHVNQRKVYPGPLSTDSGFWDAYRTVYPMLHLIYPELAAQVSEGWVNAIREDPDHMLPQWAGPNRLNSMVGAMGEVSMAEAIVNGALSDDSQKVAYTYIKKSTSDMNIKTGRAYLRQYIGLGYVPCPGTECVSISLNYYLADYAASIAADAMNDPQTAEALRNRSRNWMNLFDKSTSSGHRGYFRPKNNNREFLPNFDQYSWQGPYTEGGAWQYRFYVPHDGKNLAAAYDEAFSYTNAQGESHMCDKLLEMMTTRSTVTGPGRSIHEATEMQKHSFGQYAHNNQPTHHILYMFAHAGCPLDGQKWIHHTLRSQYGPQGFAGDEDNGEMASWYTLSSLGLYALVPGSGKYQVGAPPLFKTVTIRRPTAMGGTLTIRRDFSTTNAQGKNYFVPSKAVIWNGERSDLTKDATTIPYAELLEGGELVFSSE